MAPIEPQHLSSNWKKLQQTLATSTSKSRKRKAPSATNPQTDSHRSKRLKATPKTTNPPSMGLTSSKPQPTPQPTTNTTLTHPTNTSITSLPPPTSLSPDIPNAGLIPSTPLGKYISLDCEMVGVGPPPHLTSVLARVSILNYHGVQIYDSYVLPNPKDPITDYRTAYSGITPLLLQDARPFAEVTAQVAALLEGRVLVGHDVAHDLEALKLGHPRRNVRDTSRYTPFRKRAGGRTPGLRRLAKDVLGMEIQGGKDGHSSLEDARATMALYRAEREGFEEEHRRTWRAKSKGEEGGERGKILTGHAKGRGGMSRKKRGGAR